MKVLLWGPEGKKMTLTFTGMINWSVLPLDPCCLRLQRNMVLLLPALEALLMLSPGSSQSSSLHTRSHASRFFGLVRSQL